MYLIDDIDLILTIDRWILDLIPDLTDIIDTVVGGCIHLYDVHAGLAEDRLAARTLVARISIDRMLAVHCTCEDLRDGGLTGSTGTAEKIGMPDPPGHDLIFE